MEPNIEPKLIKLIIESLYSYRTFLMTKGLITTDKYNLFEEAIKAITEDLGEVKH